MDLSNITPEVITGLISTVLTVAGLLPWHKKQIAQLRAELPKTESIAMHVINGVRDIVKVPVVEKVMAPIEAKIEKSQLKDSTLIQYATIGLHAYQRPVESLSDTEKAALSEFVRRNTDWSTSLDEINQAVQKAQKLADEAAATDLFKNAVLFTQTIQAFHPEQQESHLNMVNSNEIESGDKSQQVTINNTQKATQDVIAAQMV